MIITILLLLNDIAMVYIAMIIDYLLYKNNNKLPASIYIVRKFINTSFRKVISKQYLTNQDYLFGMNISKRHKKKLQLY